MSGRPRLIPPEGILSIWLCLSGSLTLPRSSRHSSMTCWEFEKISLRSTFTRRFWFLVSAIPEPCCFPGLRSPETRLPIASLCYPPQPLRKAPFLPTESSASAYGKLRFCLRKAPLLPYGSSASALRKAPFSFSLCITSCNKLSFSATESSRLHCDNI